MIEKQPPPGAVAPATGVIERLLRRSLLLLTRDQAIAQDWLDLAELADAVGAPDIAQLGRDVAGLRLGFAAARPGDDAPVASIDRAVAELRQLMAQAQDRAAGAAIELGDPVAACHRLGGLLAAPLRAEPDAALPALLAAIDAAPPADPRQHIHGDLRDLVAAFATSQMQRFVQRHYALALPPYGSARRLQASAQFGPGGLGPYLADVRNIIRTSQDVIGLVALASGGSTTADQVVPWVVPLAACLPEHMLADLIDDLADLGLTAPLESLRAACSRRADTPTPLRRLRDAALDLGDFAFAGRVQATILAKWPYDAVEWRRAGDVRATAGDDAGAQAAYDYALRLAPADIETEAHRTAHDARDFAQYAVTAGFATPPHRTALRNARRAA